MDNCKGDFLNIFIFFAPSDSRFSKSCMSATYCPYKPYINGKFIYSAFKLCINLNFEKCTLMTGFVVQGQHIIWKHIYKSKHTYINSWSVCLSVSLVLNSFFYFKGISLYRNWLCKIDLPWKIFTMVNT